MKGARELQAYLRVSLDMILFILFFHLEVLIVDFRIFFRGILSQGNTETSCILMKVFPDRPSFRGLWRGGTLRCGVVVGLKL